MNDNSLLLKFELAVSAEKFYKDWLSSESHSAFTGGDAYIKEEINFLYTAWDEYIKGKILELKPGKRILQSWRTTEFNDNNEDSMLEIQIEEINPEKSKIILKQWNIPKGDVEKYKAGWHEHYIEPMKLYYNS